MELRTRRRASRGKFLPGGRASPCSGATEALKKLRTANDDKEDRPRRSSARGSLLGRQIALNEGRGRSSIIRPGQGIPREGSVWPTARRAGPADCRTLGSRKGHHRPTKGRWRTRSEKRRRRWAWAGYTHRGDGAEVHGKKGSGRRRHAADAGWRPEWISKQRASVWLERQKVEARGDRFPGGLLLLGRPRSARSRGITARPLA